MVRCWTELCACCPSRPVVQVRGSDDYFDATIDALIRKMPPQVKSHIQARASGSPTIKASRMFSNFADAVAW